MESVAAGSAVWEADGRRFVVHENSYLILNDRQRYTMTIDSAREVTTFCVFFARGFVEDVYRSSVTPASTLLDSPQPSARPQLGFYQKLETQEGQALGLLRELRARVVRGAVSRPELDEGYYALAAELLGEHQRLEEATAKLPALRSATRHELYRRLLRGRDYLLSSLDSPVRLDDVAREACLSPSHFHRSFTRAFGETPHRYLTHRRLEKAAHALAHGDSSVTDVCIETGFESLGSFSSLFRRQFGMSPREFRRARGRK